MNAYYHCLQSIHYYAILDTLELSFHIHHKVDLHVGGEKCLETVQTFAGLSSSVVSSVRSSYSHPDLLLTHHPFFQITPVLNTGLSLSEPLQLYKGYNAL